MPMNPEIKAQWVTDLRSGDYAQGTGLLNANGKLCCLGVLCEQAVKAGIVAREETLGSHGLIYQYGGRNDTLPNEVVAWAGLPSGIHARNPIVSVDSEDVSLAELNDGENGYDRHSFAQIADIIDAQL